jgi:hypothetical protein
MSTPQPPPESIRRMTRPTTVWYHPTQPPMTWSELRKTFATVGGITVARAILLGWSTNPRNGSIATANPVNALLTVLTERRP